MRKASNKATIQDVATAAGMSVATVSRAINDKSKVSPASYEKILEAMEKVGYELSAAEDTQRKIILVCVDNLADTFYEQLVEGISASAGKKGFEILLWGPTMFSTATNTKEKLIAHYRNINPSGLILTVPTNAENVLAVDRVFPIVQCCEYSTTQLPYVTVDNAKAVSSAIRFLYAHGHEKIGYLGVHSENHQIQDRMRGFREAIQELQMKTRSEWIIETNGVSVDNAMATVTHILMQEDRPSSIFASSELYASVVIRAAYNLNLRVP